MRATDIERLEYTLPVRPRAESGWNFGSLRLQSGAGIKSKPPAHRNRKEISMHTKFKLLLLVAALVAMAARTALPVMAQNPTGSIRGMVTDQHGAVIQNATVTVTNKATGDSRKVNAGSDGIYAVENLLP